MAACSKSLFCKHRRFQHTATRRWLLVNAVFLRILGNVSTHSHPKVAANWQSYQALEQFSFNTQPPEGGCQNDRTFAAHTIGFNTQPPEGGCKQNLKNENTFRCFNTQPPEGGCSIEPVAKSAVAAFQHTATRRWLQSKAGKEFEAILFQHTATRRWLHLISLLTLFFHSVSTHSHPKVAASSNVLTHSLSAVSTHSHPKVAAFS